MSQLGTDFDALLVRGAVGVLCLAASWLAVVVVAVAAEARSGGRLRFAERAGCPRLLRVWLLAGFVALFAGIAPAQAGDHSVRPGGMLGAGPALEGLQLPDRPEVDRRQVVVRPGDSLWSIARGQLRTPRRAPTAAATAAAVARLHAANRDLIGPDPDLIRPGQHLTIPEDT
jgi:nucleoid-associated protein YgaU